MPASEITVQEITAFGGEKEDLTQTAMQTDGHFFKNTGKELMIIDNDYSAPLAIVITGVANNRTFGAAPVRTVTTTNAKVSVAGPFPPEMFNDASGYVNFTVADEGDGDDFLLSVVRIKDTPAG
jgi:hypothetical protein